mmetsp:Transcript_28268/g.63723  ORF Transcript_28268/g.63723 Transcript_28268/m.63723 type:complete len:233 (+) Transcript_28268:934-1632(+)
MRQGEHDEVVVVRDFATARRRCAEGGCLECHTRSLPPPRRIDWSGIPIEDDVCHPSLVVLAAVTRQIHAHQRTFAVQTGALPQGRQVTPATGLAADGVVPERPEEVAVLPDGAPARRALAEQRHPHDELVVGPAVLDCRHVEAELDLGIRPGRADRGDGVGEAPDLDGLGEKRHPREVTLAQLEDDLPPDVVSLGPAVARHGRPAIGVLVDRPAGQGPAQHLRPGGPRLAVD